MYDPANLPFRRQSLIASYREAVDAIVVAADHLTEADLHRRPTPESQSALEIVHRLAESELQDSVQLRRMLVENTPVLHSWDDERAAERLHFDRGAAASVGAFQALALLNIELLESLTESQWHREGNDHRPWLITVDNWLEDKVRGLNGGLMRLLNAPSGGRVIEDHPDFFQSLLELVHKPRN